METIQKMPPSMKMEEWEQVVAQLMQHCSIINVPPEMGAEAQFREIVHEFLTNKTSDGSFEDLHRGMVFKNNEGYHFRLRDLHSFVRNQRFDDLKKNEMTAILKAQLNGTKGYKVVSGKGVNFITVPLAQEHPAEPLTPADFPTVF